VEVKGVTIIAPPDFQGSRFKLVLQEAQLPQRNSASAAHMEGARPSNPPPLATPMHMAESKDHFSN